MTMERVTRRSVLLGGGALAAAGVLGACAPDPNLPGWDWSPTGSLPGTGDGKDPRYVWDAPADDAVGAIAKRGEIPRVNELLRGWIKNGQELPAGLPKEVVDFI